MSGKRTVRSTPRRFSNASLGLTVLAVLGIGAILLYQRVAPTTGAKATASAAVGTQQPNETPPTPDNTAQPVGLTGEFPSAQATIPPDAPPLIPNVRIQDLATAAQARGLSCQSQAGTGQEGSGGYTLACDGVDSSGHAKLALSVTYWTLDAVSEVYLSVYPDKVGAAVSPATPIQVMSSISGISAGDVAKAWVLGRLDGDGCRDTCTQTQGVVQIELQTGDNGGRALHVFANAS